MEVWLGISKDLEISTILGIHFFQDQMANYEVQPILLEHVTLKLIQDMRSKQKTEQLPEKMTTGSEGQASSTATATASESAQQMSLMSSEAEQGCHARIE